MELYEMRFGIGAVAGKSTAATDLQAAYAEYAGPMYWYALSLLGRAEEAEDVVHDVFAAILRGARAWLSEHPWAYLLTAVRRQVLNRRRKRRECSLTEELAVSWVEVGGTGSVQIDVDRAIRELPEEQREVVTLKVLADLTFREIGAVMGIPENTAMSRYRRALEKLRARLGEDGNDV